MSEEKKIVELKDEELEKVSGGFFGVPEVQYTSPPDHWFNQNDIVEEDNGVRYRILGYDCTEVNTPYNIVWFDAICISVPDSLINMGFNYWTLGGTRSVNSSFVHKVQ